MQTSHNNSVPIGGDPAHLQCPSCGSLKTLFEEYIKPNTGDESELGIICQDCDYASEPDELGHRFEPE